MKVIETQQQAYMLDKKTNDVPDPQKLMDSHYITPEQKKAFENRKNKTEQQ